MELIILKNLLKQQEWGEKNMKSVRNDVNKTNRIITISECWQTTHFKKLIF